MSLPNYFHKKGKLLFTLVILLSFCFSASAHLWAADTVDVSAALETTNLSLDSAAVLTVTVTGARAADIQVPEVDGLIFSQRGQSTKVQFINGTSSTSTNITYLVQALRKGKYTIPPFAVLVDGKWFTSNELKITVTNTTNSSPPSAVSPRPQSSKGKEDKTIAFLTISAVKQQAYIGESVPVVIKAYFRRGLRAEVIELPKLLGDSFVLSPLSNTPQQTRDNYNGIAYSVLTWESFISPIKEGDYELKLNLETTLLLPQRNNRARSQRNPFLNDDFFNDDFFRDFFDSYQKKNVTLVNDPHSFRILPLPEEGKPDVFNGALGNFELTVQAQPRKLHVGDPLTLKMHISGKGNFDRVTAPVFPESPDWKVYTPSVDFNEGSRPSEGEKIFEQAVVANNHTSSALPAVQFSYFDPEKKKYVTLSSQPIPLQIIADANSPAVHVTPSAPPKSPDLQVESPLFPAATLRLNVGNFVEEIQPVYKKSWFITAVLICTFSLLGVLSAFLFRKYNTVNREKGSQKKMEKEISQLFNQLQSFAEQRNDNEFYLGCRSLIRLRLGLLWNMEPAAITEMDLQRKLSPESALIRLFRIADQCTYGGSAYKQAENPNELLDLLKKEMEKM